MKRRPTPTGLRHEVRCDRCSVVFIERGTLKDTEERARIRGWVVWRGTTMGGEEVTVRLCPKCRDDRSRGSRIERMRQPEGGQPLF